MEKSIKNYEKYTINTIGVVVNIYTNKKRKTCICNGYERLTLSNNGKTKSFALHRLLAEAFIPNLCGKLYVNHINGIKTDNRLENLEWCTQQENTKHAYKTGLIKGQKNYNKKSKLNDTQILEIYYAEGSCTKIAKYFNISHTSVLNIKNKKSKHEILNNLQTTNIQYRYLKEEDLKYDNKILKKDDQLLSSVNTLIFKDGKYTIDKKGNIYNMTTKKYLKPHQTKQGYLKIALYVNGGQHTYLVHRLVGMVFMENPINKPVVNHINGIKNDNRVENLEWCTQQENTKHAYKTGLNNGHVGEKNGNSKLKEKDIIQIYYSEENDTELSKKYQTSQTNISNIRNKKRWKGVTQSLKHINRKTLYLTYDECQKWILDNNKYGTYKNFKKYSKELPSYIPKNPSIFYKKEWSNWGAFLNYSKFLSYEEAKKHLTDVGIKSETQYQKVYKNMNVSLPHNPERVYKNKWEGWKIFLNKN